MPQKGRVSQRRSVRIHAQLPVLVEGKPAGESRFSEPTRAMLINAHGALISLTRTVALRERLTLSHPATKARQECTVVYLGDRQGGRTELGIEFAAAAPQFWALPNPPESWKQFMPPRKATTA